MRDLRLTRRDATARRDAPVHAFGGGVSGVPVKSAEDALHRFVPPVASRAVSSTQAWRLPSAARRAGAAAGLVAMLAPIAAPAAAQGGPFEVVEPAEDAADGEAPAPEGSWQQAPSTDSAPAAADSSAVTSTHVDARQLAALVGRRASLHLTQGRTAEGEVLSVDDEALVLALEPSLQLLTIGVDEVVAAQLLAPLAAVDVSHEPMTRNRSTPLMVTGIGTTALGATLFSLWLFPTVIYGYSASSMGTAAGVGAALMAGGTTMWIIGGRDVEVTPVVSFQAHGDRRASGGLQFSF